MNQLIKNKMNWDISGVLPRADTYTSSACTMMECTILGRLK